MANRSRIYWTTTTLDCSDAEALAAFYADVLDWEICARDGAGWIQVRNPNSGVGLNFQAEEYYEPPAWPEQHGHQAKMMHLEFLVEDLDDAVEKVVRAGGVEAAHQPADRDRARIRVMLDPDAHPFCLFVQGE